MIQANSPDEVNAHDERFGIEGTASFDFPQPPLGAGLLVSGAPSVGVVFPQPLLGDGRRLDDAVVDRFALVAAPSTASELDACAARKLRELDVAVVTEPARETSRWLDEHEVSAVVLCPNRYVFGTARHVAELSRSSEGYPPACRWIGAGRFLAGGARPRSRPWPFSLVKPGPDSAKLPSTLVGPPV